MHFYAWQSGLKTGTYYLSTKAAVDAIKFTLNNDKKEEVIPDSKPQAKVLEAVEVEAQMTPEEYRAMIELARNAGPEDCEMCGS